MIKIVQSFTIKYIIAVQFVCIDGCEIIGMLPAEELTKADAQLLWRAASGISAVFSAVNSAMGIPIRSLFTIGDIPDYKTFNPEGGQPVQG